MKNEWVFESWKLGLSMNITNIPKYELLNNNELSLSRLINNH